MTGMIPAPFSRAAARTLGVVLLLGVLGCSGISVNVERDPKADFAGYTTYAWSAASRALGPGDKVLREEIDRGLAAKGYLRVDEGRADFLVAHRVTVREYVDTDTGTGMDEAGPASGWSYSPNGGWAMKDVVDSFPTQEYAKGSLILLVIDAEARRTVWRGAATADILPGQTAEADRGRVHQVVEKLLSEFPAR